MRIDLFRMERTQCLYENEVEFNLSESGVLPMQVREILGSQDDAWLREARMKYPASRGSERLRDRIALFYGSATRDNVMVTNGGSEANYVVFWGMLEKGDRAAIMIPNYLQTWGLARAYAGHADPFRLVERRDGGRMRWALDERSLERAVTRQTKLILVTNPNNPTGAVLNEDEMDAIVRAARRVNAWIVADEVYRGAEVSGPTSPTFWGRYDKVLITAGLSKAFGLPGLRTGWIVGPSKALAKLCSYHDYLTLTPTYLSDRFAEIVMEPGRREAILARTRGIIRANLPLLERWIHSHDDIFTYVPPVAGAIAMVGYRLPIGSVALFDRLRLEQSVLITPGAHFGIGRYIRIGYGYDPGYLLKGLARVDVTLAGLQRGRAGAPAIRATDGRAGARAGARATRRGARVVAGE
jgi:aspartate/methionine/tyrosine aminotransferase